MKKTTKIISMVALLAVGCPQNSDAQFLKKLGKALETIDKVLSTTTTDQNATAKQNADASTPSTVSSQTGKAVSAVQNIAEKVNNAATQQVAYKMPQAIVYVNKKNVNVRKSPSTSGEVLTTASTGMAYEFVGEEGDWFQVKSLGTGDVCYISKTVAQKISTSSLARTDQNILLSENSDYTYQKTENTSSYSLIRSYKPMPGKQAGEVKCDYSSYGAYSDGRSIMGENVTYYGKQLGWCLWFDKSGFDEESLETMETPLLIFAYDASGRAILVNGEGFTKVKEDF